MWAKDSIGGHGRGSRALDTWAVDKSDTEAAREGEEGTGSGHSIWGDALHRQHPGNGAHTCYWAPSSCCKLAAQAGSKWALICV